MTLREIIERCRMLEVDEERCHSDEYHELVFYTQEIDAWQKIMAEVLGPAVKPPGKKPSRDHLRLTEDYGGIWADQTLFKKDFNEVTVIAMFWPWQDGIHATLKMVLLERPQPELKLSAPMARVPDTGLRAWIGKTLC